MKLRRNIYELMEKVAVFRETHLNPTLQVVRRARQNVALHVLILQSYIITLQRFRGAMFIPVHLCSGSPKERNREKSGDPGGHNYDMLLPYQRGVNMCRSAPSVEASENYSCTVPARTRNTSEASLRCFRSFVQMLQAKTSRELYMNNFVLTSCSEDFIL